MASARSSGAAQELLEPAWRMRWRVPELCLMLSDRAVAEARRAGDRTRRLRAEALALFALNRLGRGVPATARAIAAVLEAEQAGEDIAADLRVELATCARVAGSHEVALRVLEPVLRRERVDPVVRAHALLEQAASLTVRRDSGQSGDALDEAERLYSSVRDLNRDTSRLLRARVCTARACHHRRNGDFTAALEASVTGLELVRRMGDPAADSGEVHARLVLEQVQSLLDLGQRAEALEAAEAVLRQPVRAAAAGPSGWLRLSLATRIHLPDGGHGAVVLLLNDAVAHAERHKLDGLLAEALSTLSYVHERGADFVQALRCLRNAYSADRRWRAAVQTARVRLLEELPTLSGDVPRSRARYADRSPLTAEPEPVQPEPPQAGSAESEPAESEPAWPSATPTDAPTPTEQPPVVRSGRRRARDDVHDAARRLMETLTSRANSTDAGATPDASDSTPDAARPVNGSATADWTAMLPRLSRPPHGPEGGPSSSEPSGTQHPPLLGTSPASLGDHAETEIGDSPRTSPAVQAEATEGPDSPVNGSMRSPAGDGDAEEWDSGVPADARHSAVDSSESMETVPDFPAQSPDTPPTNVVPWPPVSTADEGAPAPDDQARVQSLAEIRASLRRIQERSRLRPPVTSGDARPASQPDPGLPPDSGVPPDSGLSTAESGAAMGTDEPRRRRESSHDPASAGSVRDDAGLADLLAEALVAFETGRRGEEAQRRRRAPETQAVETQAVDTTAVDTDAGSTDAGGTGAESAGTPRARHRRPSPDQDSDDPPSPPPGRY